MPRTTDTGASEVRRDTEEHAEFLEWTGNPLTGSSAAPFEERVLTRADLKRTYGVDLPEGTGRLVWNAENRHRIPATDLTPQVIQAIVENEAGFRVTDKP